MFDRRFTQPARDVLVAAERLARTRGADDIEAEHLLLALAELGEPELAAVDVAAILDREFEESLAAAGVRVTVPPAVPSQRSPGWGASAKRTVERGARICHARGDKRFVPGHLLLGILAAEEGTVPRALRIAGLDREALASQVQARL